MLSLVKPVVSQGPANLSVEVGQIDFDWFLLAIYPLIYDWPLEYLWGMLFGVTGLLYLTPWLPPVDMEPQMRLRRMCSLGEANSAETFIQSQSSSSATSWARAV